MKNVYCKIVGCFMLGMFCVSSSAGLTVLHELKQSICEQAEYDAIIKGQKRVVKACAIYHLVRIGLTYEQAVSVVSMAGWRRSKAIAHEGWVDLHFMKVHENMCKK